MAYFCLHEKRHRRVSQPCVIHGRVAQPCVFWGTLQIKVSIPYSFNTA
ncbi:hypothetical protein F383_37379 [Gossypium arboreum]|uniref:Uncharacterized protein n=1 Tax=Gossypium arboreum TaxID=29729 RepID=A0A0B0MGT1_GOSAR|nr:hypothetical protein F383_37379 [Gossypium arboreum]